MSQDQNLLGTWHVYRYHVSRHVLKFAETTLAIEVPKPPDDMKLTYLARFQVSGVDEPFDVLMDKADPGRAGKGHYGGSQETKTETWIGESDGFDFRWDLHVEDQPGILIGYAADRHNPDSRDTFIALTSPRKCALPDLATYDFQRFYLTPLARTRPSRKGDAGVCIRPHDKEFWFEKTRYEIIYNERFEHGRKLIAETTGPGDYKTVGLWLLPTDGSDRLLAIGYHSHYHITDPTVPRNPECQFTLQLA